MSRVRCPTAFSARSATTTAVPTTAVGAAQSGHSHLFTRAIAARDGGNRRPEKLSNDARRPCEAT